MKDNKEKKIMNVIQLAEFLEVKVSWVRQAVFYKRIPHIKIGQLVRFEENEILKWLESKKQEVA